MHYWPPTTAWEEENTRAGLVRLSQNEGRQSSSSSFGRRATVIWLSRLSEESKVSEKKRIIIPAIVARLGAIAGLGQRGNPKLGVPFIARFARERAKKGYRLRSGSVISEQDRIINTVGILFPGDSWNRPLLDTPTNKKLKKALPPSRRPSRPHIGLPILLLRFNSSQWHPSSSHVSSSSKGSSVSRCLS